MSTTTIGLSEALRDYMLKVSLRETPLLEELRRETLEVPGAGMQISPEQGQLMALLVKLAGATRILEVGTFTGYSSLAMAMALPSDGRLIACDINAETTAIARRFWERAGVADKIDLRLAPALETLDGLIAEGARGSFDLAFIDADKENYEGYFERCLALVRIGGVILVDNVLWGGSVIDESDDSVDTEAIRAFNAARRDDQRVELSMLPIGDGLSLLRRVV